MSTIVIEEKKNNFCEAASACNAVSISAFTKELHSQVDEYFKKDA